MILADTVPEAPAESTRDAAAPRAGRCGNAVIARTNLPASARAAKVGKGVGGGGEPDALSTGHGPIICGSEISQCDFATQDKKKKEKRGRLLLLPPMLWLLHNTRGGGQISHKYTGKWRRRRIPLKTSALTGPTTVITRHRFQIRHLGS